MDRERLRQVAATRPGYATYPDTAPGSPSWWQRPTHGQRLVPEGVASVPPPAKAVPAPPPPSAGAPVSTAPAAVATEAHTWTTADVERVCAGLGVTIQPWQAQMLQQLFNEPYGGVRPRPPAPTGWITLTEPPARWWHRFTRRAGR